MQRRVTTVRLFSTRVEVVQSAPVISWAGARQLNLGSNGQEITPQGLNNLSTKLQSYVNNNNVGVVAFSSSGSSVFAQHLPQNTETVKAVNQFIERLAAYEKPTITSFDGDLKSTSFGTFAHSRFRLATESTKLVLDDFAHGRLPLGGGISSLLVGNKRDGVAFARYVVSSQQQLSAMDMHKLGYLTHVVAEDALSVVLPVVADVANIKSTKASQPRSDVVDSIGELLDTLHIETNQLGRVFLHPAWSKAVLVPPSECLPEDEEVAEENVDEVRELVVHCFSPDDPEESMKRLELLAKDASHKQQKWAADTLAVLKKNDSSLMKTWFKFTKHVAKKPLANVIALEEQLVASMKE